MTPVAVVGRDEELASLHVFASSLGGGPAALIVRGEPGIGKTTLWRAGVETAREQGLGVLAATPAEAETKLSFAALGDLLEGVLPDVLSRLPAPQRHALEVALLLEEAAGPPPDRRAVAVAFLTAVRALADKAPLVLAVDDVQWLDASSAGVLQFVARRLRAEPVGLLIAERVTQPGPMPLELERALSAHRLGSIELGPLTLGAVHRLLHERLGATFPRPLLLRLHQASGGNPFFALEIGRALDRGDIRPTPGHPLPVPRSLDELAQARISALPAETRRLLLIASASSDPTVPLVAEVLGGGDAHATIRPAIDNHVVALENERIRFAHPLLASAAYMAADRVEQRAVHRRLAAVVDELEERARHLALAAETEDSEIATVLDEAARRARARGAPAAAAELAEEALRLTPAHRHEESLRRKIDAAGHHFEAGDAGQARSLLEEAARDSPPGPRRAEALMWLARAHAFEADLRVAVRVYREALAEAEQDSDAKAEADRGLAVGLMRMLEDLPTAARHARAAVGAAERRRNADVLPDLLASQGLIEGLLGRPGARALVQRAAELDELGSSSLTHFMSALRRGRFMLGVFLLWAEDLEDGRRNLEFALERALEAGDESSLPLLFRYLAFHDWLAGEWARASLRADDGYEIALQTGQPSQQAVLIATKALALAYLGREGEARQAAEEGIRLADETGAMFGTLLALSALGFLELSLGNPAAAHGHLGPLGERLEAAGVREPGVLRFIPDEVESLVALGRLDEAEALLARLEKRARKLDRVSALGAAGRCRGLLLAARGDIEGALESVRGALVALEQVPMPFERARTLLALGALERRARQKRAAREALNAALAVFEQLGAALWAEKARLELARIGGRASASDGLTPTERRVAELVAQGLGSKQVAAKLFLSPKTVEGHLSRIYTKLGVHSRVELARRILDDHVTHAS
jgi:DNA-binding CsgD family transcriptional regulator